MELVILCLLSWPWTPGAAPGLGRTVGLQRQSQVGDLPPLAWIGAAGAAQPGRPVSAGGLKENASQGAAGKGSPHAAAADQADWDFTLVLIAISMAALVLISQCCFCLKCLRWLLCCLHPAWQGGAGSGRPLPRISFVSSLRRYGAVASGTSQGLAAESSYNVWLTSSAQPGEPCVHFRRASTGVPKEGSASLPAAAPGNGTRHGPPSETVLEIEDEL